VKTVWKYVLGPRDNTFQMPVGAKILHVGRAQGELALWALVDSDAEKIDRHFFTVGTGHELPDKGTSYVTFIGTTMVPNAMPGMDIVIHVFEYSKQ